MATTGDSSLTQTYFFSDVFAIDRNTALYVAPSTDAGADYDYIISLDASTLSQFFTTSTYTQNANNLNSVDVTLTLNDAALNAAIDASSMTSPTGTGTGGKRSLLNGVESSLGVDTRILEILALKIFGHARARAAIANDTEIIAGLKYDLFNHIHTIVSDHKNDIFNQYVNYDLAAMNTNDIDVAVSFEFTNDMLSFPAYLNGSLYNSANAAGGVGEVSAALKNGPDSGDANDTKLENGLYNIPILFKIGKIVA